MITRLFLSYIVDEAKKLPTPQQEELMGLVRAALPLLDKNKKGVRDNALLQSFASVIRVQVVPCFDQLPLSFFSLPLTQKQSILKNTISQDTCLHRSLFHILSFFTAEEIQKQLARFLIVFSEHPKKLFVKSASEIDSSLRADIRAHYPDNFIIFKIQRGLLGGIQIYHQGKLSDATWKGKLDAMSSMLSQA